MFDAVPNPAAPQPQRLLARIVFSVLFLTSCTVPISADDGIEDEDAEGEIRAAEKRLNIVPAALLSTEMGEQTFEEVVFGARGEHAAGVRAWLDALLVRKVDTVDRLSRLSDAQKRKLHLAGRGDIKRFFDRVEAQRAQILLLTRAALDERTAGENFAATRRLRHVLDLGPFEDGSLFAKTVNKSLTARQAQRAELLREIERAGGFIENGQDGGEEWYNVELSATEFSDAAMIHIQYLDGLRRLTLNGTRVTDLGMAHLTKVTALQFLDLSDTAITDAGLVHLKGLISLQYLYLPLDDSKVTDLGIADLKKALPKVAIKR